MMENNIIFKIKEIFIIYIIILLNLKIITEHESIKIYYGFYKSNFNLFIDKNYLFQILQILKSIKYNILLKYICFIYIIAKIDTEYYEIINLYNKSKIGKAQLIKITHDNIINCKIDQTNDIYNELDFIFDNLKDYLVSFDRSSIFKYFLMSKNEYIKNIHKHELINRLEQVKKIVGDKLLYLLVNKKNRKYTYQQDIIIHNKEYLIMMTYNELYYYSQSIFNKINENIKDYLKDIEFVKYLKIIVLCYLDDYNDKTSKKFYEKLVKKYII